MIRRGKFRELPQNGSVVWCPSRARGQDHSRSYGGRVLAEGTQGHLTGAALERFGLRGENPQVWALGVKEVWKVAKPLDQVIHTMGWPLRPGKKFREFGGSFVYPMGDDMVTIGMVVGLDYRDAELSVHDLLQELKTHPRIRRILDGGERVQWGAKTIPEGGFVALPSRFHAPGLLLCGDGVGLVNVPALKGIHYAVESGRLAAEAVVAHAGSGRVDAHRARVVRRVAAQVVHLERPPRSPEHAPGVRSRLLCRRRAGRRHDGVEGPLPAGRRAYGTRCRPVADQHLSRSVVSGGGWEARVRQALERLCVGEPDA